MVAQASPDNPIHRMKASEFAHLIEQHLFGMAGGRPQFSHDKTRNPDGTVTIGSTFFANFAKDRVTVEKDAPPDDPMGPPLGMMGSIMGRLSKEERSRAGLKPAFSGGMSGAFEDLHIAFIGAASQFGLALDKDKLGNDPEQNQRIKALLAQWTDHMTHEGRKDKVWESGVEYPKQLAAELATVKKVPLKLKDAEGKTLEMEVDNRPIGLENAPLAHVLIAAEKNALALNGRPYEEMKFITAAIGGFSRILDSTDQVHDYIREQMVAQGVPDPDGALKKSKLAFDSQRAERILLNHAPTLKLMNVIAPLTLGHAHVSSLNPLLELVGDKVEDTPPIQNAEQGARLLETLLTRFTKMQDLGSYPHKEEGTSERENGLNADAIRRHLRGEALARPFDVANLGENPEVQKLLALAESYRGRFEDVDRALRTWERALSQQQSLAGEREAIADATTYKPGKIRAVAERVWHGKWTGRAEGSTLAAIDSGMNRDEYDALMRDVIALFDDPKNKDVNFSTAIREEMKNRAARSSKDVPPVPGLT